MLQHGGDGDALRGVGDQYAGQQVAQLGGDRQGGRVAEAALDYPLHGVGDRGIKRGGCQRIQGVVIEGIRRGNEWLSVGKVVSYVLMSPGTALKEGRQLSLQV